jgi:hypothetical protein
MLSNKISIPSLVPVNERITEDFVLQAISLKRLTDRPLALFNLNHSNPYWHCFLPELRGSN